MTSTAVEVIRPNGEVVQAGALMPVVTIDAMLQRSHLMQGCIASVMKDGRDYGVIPGTDKNRKEGDEPRKTLLKPGAEKLCTFFGLTPDFQEDSARVDFEKGLFWFSYRCVLLSGATQEMTPDGRVVTLGRIVGTGIGSANSREKKYLRVARACPSCGAAAVKRSKFPPRDDPHAEPGWYCHAQAGGCGANFAADDRAVTEQAGQVNPDEAADLVNTLQKMAQKRAMIAAVLIATNASDTFTQDVEDMERPPEAAPPAGRTQGRAKAAPKKGPPADGAEFERRVQELDALAVTEGATAGDLVKVVRDAGVAKGRPARLDMWPPAAWKEGGETGKAYLAKLRSDNAAQAPEQPAAPPASEPQPDAQPAPAAPPPAQPPPDPDAARVGPGEILPLERELARIGEAWHHARHYAGLPDGTRMQEITVGQWKALMGKLKTLSDAK